MIARALAALVAAFVLAPLVRADRPDSIVAESGFETAPAGAIEGELRFDGLVVHAEPGHAEIHTEHQRSGAQSLRVLGGAEREVVVELEGGAEEVHRIYLWAERWTRRDPFACTVDVRVRGAWQPAWDGSTEVAVGSFPTRVVIDIDLVIDAFRIRTTSPEGSGLIVDELLLTRSVPQLIERVIVDHLHVPVLAEHDRNALIRIVIRTSGSLGRHRFQEMGLIGCSGPSSSGNWHPPQLELLHGPPDAIPRPGAEGWNSLARSPAHAHMELHFDVELDEGENVFWLCGTARPPRAPGTAFGVGVVWIYLQGRPILQAGRGIDEYEYHHHWNALALRDAGDDGSACYRIPGLVRTNSGALVAVYDIRWDDCSDLPGDIDVGVQRSTDGGLTWSSMEAAIDYPAGDATHGNGVGDPSILVDTFTGRIWIAALWSHGDRGWHGSGPGLEPTETGQLVLVHSDDDGITWSEPRSITAEVKDPSWRLFLQGPGKGITTSDGSLVFPCQYRDADGLPHATLLVSHDRGETWSVGAPARPDTTEAQVVELDDGLLMLNMRDNRGGSRAVAVTDDFGATWTEHPSSRSALPEPVCMASLIHVGRELGSDEHDWLLFSNPHVDAPPRRDMTIQASPDGGLTWPEEHRVLLDEGVSAGYSCLAMIDDETVGILYESSRAQLVFQRIPLAELIGPPRSR